MIKNIDINEKEPGKSYCFAASYAHKSKHNLFGVGLSGVNKVKVIKDEAVVAELNMQAGPLCLDFYQFNNKDFMLVSGVEGTVYVVKVKMLDLDK